LVALGRILHLLLVFIVVLPPPVLPFFVAAVWGSLGAVVTALSGLVVVLALVWLLLVVLFLCLASLARDGSTASRASALAGVRGGSVLMIDAARASEDL
jgi:hypothetical protein